MAEHTNSLDTARLMPHVRTRSRRLILKACAGCGKKSATARCPDCAPSTTYDGDYRRARAATLTEEFVCWICGKPGTPNDPLTADHVVALIDGGNNARSNLRAAHASCNYRRGAAITNGKRAA